jgi:hypothetical protein
MPEEAYFNYCNEFVSIKVNNPIERTEVISLSKAFWRTATFLDFFN